MHQDAHEFLNYLLNKIVEEIEEEKKLTHVSVDDCTWKIHNIRLFPLTLVFLYFQPLIQSNLHLPPHNP